MFGQRHYSSDIREVKKVGLVGGLPNGHTWRDKRSRKLVCNRARIATGDKRTNGTESSSHGGESKMPRNKEKHG
jgi:hypothetical protein